MKIPANPRADLWTQETKKFEGKIKLENKLIDAITIEFFKGLSKAIVTGTRGGSHKMFY